MRWFLFALPAAAQAYTHAPLSADFHLEAGGEGGDFHLEADPAPTEGQTVKVSDQLQVTVLSPALLRVQFAQSAALLHNHRTTAIINRRFPKAVFSSSWSQDGSEFRLHTAEVDFRWKKGAYQRWTDGLVKLELVKKEALREENVEYGVWSAAQPYAGNLFGTIRTLDGQTNPTLDCAKFAEQYEKGGKDEYHCSYGVVSR